MANEKPSISVVDLDALGKPLEKLIEVVANGAGVLYEPRRIREKAKAEADAAVTAAQAEVEIADIQTRAQRRREQQDVRRQKNVEKIIAEAARQLPVEVSEKSVDPDWAIQFFNVTQDIGNEEMQLLWARILAGEIAEPGTFSRRAITTVGLMDQLDAALFQTLTRYVWVIADHTCIVLNDNSFVGDIEGTEEVTFGDLFHLDGLGLLQLNHVSGKAGGPDVTVTNAGKRYAFNRGPDKQDLVLNGHGLTAVGRELYGLCDPKPDDEYVKYWIVKWINRGWAVAEAE